MAAYVPIIYRIDGSYIIPVTLAKPGSVMTDIEFVPRDMLEAFIKESRINGIVVEPTINHGFH